MSISFRVDSPEEEAFRAEVRAWLEANLPQDLRGLSVRPPFHRAQDWHRSLYEHGWIAPHWPKKHGGMGATLNQRLILREEMARIGAPEVSGQGLNHVGPVLMEFGTEAQRARHLPPILTGEVTWCQGYSEPNAGSDLASLRTRAEIDGEEFVITGQKIWTTWAHHADWIFLLARTDPNAPRKQMGISFILCDLRTPGITIRPIRTIAGDDEFAEVFFDAVRVPMENLVGPLHDGWRVANALLSHERLGSGSPTMAYAGLDRVKRLARANGLMDDEAFRDRLAEVELDVVTLAAVHAHAASLSNAEESLGHEASMMKIFATETVQRVADLLFETAGGHGADLDRVPAEGEAVDVATLLLQVRRDSIYGGSNEIQRNILARRVLGLPA